MCGVDMFQFYVGGGGVVQLFSEAGLWEVYRVWAKQRGAAPFPKRSKFIWKSFKDLIHMTKALDETNSSNSSLPIN